MRIYYLLNLLAKVLWKFCTLSDNKNKPLLGLLTHLLLEMEGISQLKFLMIREMQILTFKMADGGHIGF